MIIGKPEETKVEQPLCVGMLVLLNLAKYAGEWPQLGKIVDTNSDSTIVIQWYQGSRTGSWMPCTRPVRGEGSRGKRSPWTESVPCSSVWCHGFHLTPAGKLPQKVREKVDSFSDF